MTALGNCGRLAISSLTLCVYVSQVIDVHLLQKPLVSFPFTVLGACLSTTVVLRNFSRLSTPYQPLASSGNLCLQLLFRFNLGMPLYLWLVSLLETFEERWGQFQSQAMPKCALYVTWVSSRPKDHKVTVLGHYKQQLLLVYWPK